jgi:hypothetical protein
VLYSTTIQNKKVIWLKSILTGHLSLTEAEWFREKILPLTEVAITLRFNLLFSMVPRFIPATIPEWSAEQLAEVTQFQPGFSASSFDLQQLCRLLLMVQLPADRNQQILEPVFETADIKELVSLYKGLYWLPNAENFTLRIAEGIRTNMTDVFDAIALQNPYPFQYLTENAWNQMVLKAIFMGRPLHQIYRLRERNNTQLALILHDYIHERWSAGRTVTPEIWQLMPGFVNDAIEADLKRAAASTDMEERNAALKALAESGFSETTITDSREEPGKTYNN